jgi:hypothetical protein
MYGIRTHDNQIEGLTAYRLPNIAFGCKKGIDPLPLDSQSSILPLNYKHHMYSEMDLNHYDEGISFAS